ncbi:MAG: hypothetical protein AB1646_09995 [Thermodesulfobacteriota bacterium]
MCRVAWKRGAGEAPLVRAVERGDVAIVKALLEKGAQLDGDLKPHSLGQASAQSGYKEILELLKARGLKPSDPK